MKLNVLKSHWTAPCWPFWIIQSSAREMRGIQVDHGRPPKICRSKILKSKPNKNQHIRNILGKPSCSFSFVAHLCTSLHCTMGISTIAIQGSVMRVTTAVLITMASQVMALEGQARPIWEWQLGCSMALFHHQGGGPNFHGRNCPTGGREQRLREQ